MTRDVSCDCYRIDRIEDRESMKQIIISSFFQNYLESIYLVTRLPSNE